MASGSRWRGMARRAVEVCTRRKPVDMVDTIDTEERLNKVLSVWDAIGIGVGATIGAGVFVLTGVAAKHYAGPSIALSYIISGFACILSGLSYAEFASRYPFTGSAYLYSYCSVGELMAWIVGWDLFLEYVLAAAAVSRGWSSYTVALFSAFGLTVPSGLYRIEYNCGPDEATNEIVCQSIDLLAGAVLIFMTLMTALGTKFSSMVNVIMNAVTVGIVVLVIILGAVKVDPINWSDFFPFGVHGTFKGAAVIFFAYVGFDTVSTFAEETRNPKRDMPLAIVGTVTVCMALYAGVALVITGMVNYSEIDLYAPLSVAFGSLGWEWAQVIISIGAFFALSTSILSSLLGMPRIFFAMARDGLLIPQFKYIHPKYKTPIVGAITAGTLAVALAVFLDIEALSDMVSIGTLLAFVMVNMSVLIQRYRLPPKGPGEPAVDSTILIVVMTLLMIPFCASIDSEWPFAVPVLLGLVLLVPFLLLCSKNQVAPADAAFTCPWVPLLPSVAMLFNLYLMINLGWVTWLRMLVWAAIGLVIYGFYGSRNSKLNKASVGGDANASSTMSNGDLQMTSFVVESHDPSEAQSAARLADEDEQDIWAPAILHEDDHGADGERKGLL